jgi:hypothetical protein
MRFLKKIVNIGKEKMSDEFRDRAETAFDTVWFSATVEQRATVRYIINPKNNVCDLEFRGARGKINSRIVTLLVCLHWAKTLGLPAMFLTKDVQDAKSSVFDQVPHCKITSTAKPTMLHLSTKTILGDTPVLYIMPYRIFGQLLMSLWRVKNYNSGPISYQEAYATTRKTMSHFLPKFVNKGMLLDKELPERVKQELYNLFSQQYSCVMKSGDMIHPKLSQTLDCINACIFWASLSLCTTHQYYCRSENIMSLGDFISQKNFTLSFMENK